VLTRGVFAGGPERSQQRIARAAATDRNGVRRARRVNRSGMPDRTVRTSSNLPAYAIGQSPSKRARTRAAPPASFMTGLALQSGIGSRAVIANIVPNLTVQPFYKVRGCLPTTDPFSASPRTRRTGESLRKAGYTPAREEVRESDAQRQDGPRDSTLPFESTTYYFETGHAWAASIQSSAFPAVTARYKSPTGSRWQHHGSPFG
jgi:hypothetical protein